jgi:uncharacterized membrane protein YraQ (UPF0718 family)
LTLIDIGGILVSTIIDIGDDVMDGLNGLAGRVAADVWTTLATNWPYLVLSVLAAAALAVYVGPERLSGWLARRPATAVAGAVALATLTPFCSCGTTAVVLGMIATTSPWAPIVAFMVASPLTSPEELLLSAGLFGWPFALIFFLGTIALGMAAGVVTLLLERMGWLAGQARVRPAGCADSQCTADGEPARTRVRVSMCPGAASIAEPLTLAARLKLPQLAAEVWSTGRRLLVLFLAFTTIGYTMIELIPTDALTGLLGGSSAVGVPAAALLGIPVYLSTDASLPMVAALVTGGMGLGPAMAFLVTGAGTSIGAISGAFVIARARIVGLVVGLLFAGGLVLGLTTQLIL